MKDKLLIFLGGILLLVLLYLGYQIILWLSASFKEIDPTVGAAIIASAATVISSVFIASYNSRKAKERVAFEAHREKKAEIYNEFMGMVVQVMRNTKNGKEGDEALPDNVQEFFFNFTSRVAVYGGPGVVKAYGKWRSESSAEYGESNAKAGFLLLDSLFREMLADLGESNKSIEKNELLGLFIIGGKSQLAKEANKAIQHDVSS